MTAATANASSSSSTSMQNWNINKENLIYSMANQLAKYDQLDEQFMQFCISKLICMEFNFKIMYIF